jgi:hypothetical protein
MMHAFFQVHQQEIGERAGVKFNRLSGFGRWGCAATLIVRIAEQVDDTAVPIRTGRR